MGNRVSIHTVEDLARNLMSAATAAWYERERPPIDILLVIPEEPPVIHLPITDLNQAIYFVV
jgi:hypothetical protein